MDPKELRSAIEAVLFITNEPVKLDDLVEAFGEAERAAIVEQLDELRRVLEANIGGFMLEQTAGGWRLATRPEHEPTLKKYFAKKGEKPPSLPGAETQGVGR